MGLILLKKKVMKAKIQSQMRSSFNNLRYHSEKYFLHSVNQRFLFLSIVKTGKLKKKKSITFRFLEGIIFHSWLNFLSSYIHYYGVLRIVYSVLFYGNLNY